MFLGDLRRLGALACTFERCNVDTPNPVRRGATACGGRALTDSNEFLLPLPRAYRCAPVLEYFGRDQQGTAELVAGTTISKAYLGESGPIVLTIELRPSEAQARCRFHGPALISATDRVTGHHVAARMLGLQWDSQGWERRARREATIARLVSGRTGLHPPLTANVFEAVVWAVVGQQVNLSFATQLRRALIKLAGRRIAASDLLLHPTPAEIANLTVADLASRQFSRSKAQYLIGVAEAVARGEIALDHSAGSSPDALATVLRTVRGIGPWSAQYIMLRGFGLGDCAPIGDSGLSAGLQRFFRLERRPNPAQQGELMQVFAPHRSLATGHLWALSKELE